MSNDNIPSARHITISAVGPIWAVIFLFVWFWMHSGWYRIDCALGIERACELIRAEYSAKLRP